MYHEKLIAISIAGALFVSAAIVASAPAYAGDYKETIKHDNAAFIIKKYGLKKWREYREALKAVEDLTEDLEGDTLIRERNRSHTFFTRGEDGLTKIKVKIKRNGEIVTK